MELFGPPISPLSDDQRVSDTRIKMIKKLRWMGMNDEAERLQTEVAERDLQPADSVVAGPPDTD
jgi:hypothetical protein